jgi:hypothetical protein
MKYIRQSLTNIEVVDFVVDCIRRTPDVLRTSHTVDVIVSIPEFRPMRRCVAARSYLREWRKVFETKCCPFIQKSVKNTAEKCRKSFKNMAKKCQNNAEKCQNTA